MTVTLLTVGVPTIYVYGGSILVALLFLVPIFYTLYWETNIDRIEKYLIKQKKQPATYLIYAMANRQDEEVSQLIKLLLTKYRHPQRQAIYKVFYAAYKKDLSSVRDDILSIQSTKYRYYYEAAMHVQEGNMELARKTSTKVASVWMRNILLSGIELRSGNRQEAIDLARLALQDCKGISRYQIYKNFENELPEALEAV